MTIALLLLCPAVVAMFWIIRFQICISRRRYLVDTYGVDPKKFQKLSCKQVKAFKGQVEEMQHADKALGLEELIRPFRP